MEQYQDIWVKGKLSKPGIRETESRYELIKSIASQYDRPFTVLDIGANLGYFAIRLTEDFPNCTVVAIEGIYSNWLKEVLSQNESERVILLERKFSLDDLRKLAKVEHFDLVLAMSVIHHIKGSFGEVLETVRSLGDNVIAETATEDRACGQSSVKESFIPEDASILGYGKSHLKGPKRPVFLLQQKRTHLAERFIGCTRPDKLEMEIESDFSTKKMTNRDETRDWHRGINLKTFRYFGGSRPNKNKIVEMLEPKKPTTPHHDLNVHNIILQGDDVQIIDFNDPAIKKGVNDNKAWSNMLRMLRG